MVRKAQVGHVTGGRVFGYDNVDIIGVHGRMSNGASTRPRPSVVRRILELAAAGLGQMRIARQLNEEYVRAPRPQRGRPRGWAQSSVHAVLFGGEALSTARRSGTDGVSSASRFDPSMNGCGSRCRALRILPEDVW